MIHEEKVLKDRTSRFFSKTNLFQLLLSSFCLDAKGQKNQGCVESWKMSGKMEVIFHLQWFKNRLTFALMVWKWEVGVANS
jgi:hypothetical protein